MTSINQDALEYHESGKPGKLEIKLTKSFLTQRDLSLAYTPGVAEPCRRIQQNPADAFRYTTKGNLVAVISNGTAVLGLGNIGALASKPVMEGKAILFKRFADIDVFDLEINEQNPQKLIETIKRLEPTFGGINLEDIKAPDCFEVEESLKKQMNIPVVHDDQHGTAIITGAALLNALTLVNKSISEVKVVFNGAGAAAIACAKLHLQLGVKLENLIMCDTKGVIYQGRTEGMNESKAFFASNTTARTLSEAFCNADVFIGLSVKDAVTPEMLKSMAPNPIIFTLANPDPEIDYYTAIATRPDAIIATGRSDYPNQVNNVLGFPYIFRGTLDVRAIEINDTMKIAAVHALANLAREEVPHSVKRAYAQEDISFGKDYLIPKPFDHRVLFWVAPAVAQAAMDTGVAHKHLDIEEYKQSLEERMGFAPQIIRHAMEKAKTHPQKIVFPEGDNEKILKAVHILVEENIAYPIILGSETVIKQKCQELGLNLEGIEIIDPHTSPNLSTYTEELFKLRQRHGLTLPEAKQKILNRNIFGSMMLHSGDADGFVSGVSHSYNVTLKSALEVIGTQSEYGYIAGLTLMILNHRAYFFADTTVNVNPSAETLAAIAMESARLVQRLDIKPRIAMLSFSDFGTSNHKNAEKVRQAVEIVKQKQPDLIIDGEMRADTAVNPALTKENYPFSRIQGNANVLIFPDLQSGNIAYKLLHELGGAEAIGPILMGMAKPVHILNRSCEVNNIVNMAAIAVLDAEELKTDTH
jgi:malate dehydrogenase (oxaloacetate-decarboxylating)(NADP+)